MSEVKKTCQQKKTASEDLPRLCRPGTWGCVAALAYAEDVEHVAADLAGYRTGSMNRRLTPTPPEQRNTKGLPS